MKTDANHKFAISIFELFLYPLELLPGLFFNSDFHFVHEPRMFYKVVINWGLIKCIIIDSGNYSVKCKKLEYLLYVLTIQSSTSRHL